MPVPNTFANATATIPLSQLDANFATAITLGNTAIQLGNTVTTLNNMTLANVTISSGNVTITNVSVTTANVTTANIATEIVTTSQTLNYGTANGVVYLNGSKVSTTGTALVFDGTNLGVGTSSPSGRLHVANTGTAGTTADNLNAFFSSANRNSNVYIIAKNTENSNLYFGDADSNTVGALVYDHTGNYLRFDTNAGERMRLDSSGNLGLGVTPSAWVTATGRKAIEIGSLGNALFGNGTADFSMLSNAYLNSSAQTTYANTGYAARYQQADGAHRFYTAASGTAGNAITFTQAMTLDASGNLLVGTTSSLYSSANRGVIEVNGSTSSLLGFKRGDANGFYIHNTSTTVDVWNQANTPIVFATNNSERARITAGGEVYIAGTTDQGAYNLQCNGTGVWGAGAYVNGSDARIKDDIAPIASGLDVVTKLNPVTYRYKEDWSKDQSVQTGFIAQELLTALEGEVYVDGVVQQGGSEGYYSVAYQNIIPILTKAIQELKAELDATKAEVALLKGAA